MFGIIGIVFLLICVFGSYVVGGGSLAPFIHAAPIEGWCILGSDHRLPIERKAEA